MDYGVRVGIVGTSNTHNIINDILSRLRVNNDDNHKNKRPFRNAHH